MNDTSELSQQVHTSKELTSHQQQGSADDQQQHHVNNSHHHKSDKISKTLIIIKYITTCIFWIICLSAFGLYVYESIHEYIKALPVTSVSFVPKDEIDYPAVTICNFNSGYDCDTCGISLLKVVGVNQSTGAMEELKIANQYKEFDQKGLFRCIVFNNQSESFNLTNDIGFTSTYSMFFKVPIMPLNRNNRNGIQISFHVPGTIPDLYGESNFAVENVDNMYILTKTRTIKLKTSKEFPNLETVRWTYKKTTIDLTRKETGMFVISISYATLKETKNKEVNTATIEKLLGEIVAILVALMGLDGLKVINAILELGYSFKHKSLMNVWNIFNKGRWH